MISSIQFKIYQNIISLDDFKIEYLNDLKNYIFYEKE